MFPTVAARSIGTTTSDLTWFSRFCALIGFRSSRSKPAPVSTNSGQVPQQASSEKTMFTSSANMVAARIPMIKFVGARLPRPNFNRNALPSIPISGASSGAPIAAAKPTSIGPVGKIPRGQGISESQLPLRFQRSPISQEECDLINNGGVL